MFRDTPNISFRNNRAYNDSDGLVVLCHFETVMSVSVKQWMRMCWKSVSVLVVHTVTNEEHDRGSGF